MPLWFLNPLGLISGGRIQGRTRIYLAGAKQRYRQAAARMKTTSGLTRPNNRVGIIRAGGKGMPGGISEVKSGTRTLTGARFIITLLRRSEVGSKRDVGVERSPERRFGRRVIGSSNVVLRTGGQSLAGAPSGE